MRQGMQIDLRLVDQKKLLVGDGLPQGGHQMDATTYFEVHLGVKEPIRVAASGLRTVESHIRMSKQSFRIVSRLVHRYADADTGMDHICIEQKRLFHRIRPIAA